MFLGRSPARPKLWTERPYADDLPVEPAFDHRAWDEIKTAL